MDARSLVGHAVEYVVDGVVVAWGVLMEIDGSWGEVEEAPAMEMILAEMDAKRAGLPYTKTKDLPRRRDQYLLTHLRPVST